MVIKTKKTTRNKTGRKVAGRAVPKRKIPGWIILLSGMLFGLLIAVFGYVNGWVPKPDNPNEKPIAQSSQTKSSTVIEGKSTDLQIQPKKSYDFYETLQDMEVVVDDIELIQEDNLNSISYTLQLGAFKRVEEAESLKAKVAFIGLLAVIQSVDVNDNHWHRVRLGPYKSGRKADKVKKNLESNGFNALILKEK